MLPWHELVPVDKHEEFLAGERRYCWQEEQAFHAAVDDVEEKRLVVLNKREEYLQHFIEQHNQQNNKENICL